MLKKVISTLPPHTFFFTAKRNVFPGSTNISFYNGGFVILGIVFGCDNPAYNPSPVQEFSLLTQFSGITTLQSLVLQKQFKGAWPIMVLPMRIDNLTHNPSPSSY